MTEKQPPPSRTADQFVIRFVADGIRAQIKDRADRNHRSMNAEINARLIESLKSEKAPNA